MSAPEERLKLKRRDFLSLAAAGAANAIAGSNLLARAAFRPGIKAIAFDGFTIFDPRPIAAMDERLFPGKGADLGNVWRTRQFEYTWLRTLMNQYADFWQVTEEALVFAANALKLRLTPGKRRQLMHAWLDLNAWPDVLPALKSLRDAGIRLAFLSNLIAPMIDAAIRNSEGIFEPHLSTDRVHAFKPDARAYGMAIEAFDLPCEEIAFAAFGGWAAAGAKAFGYPTYWVNRANAPSEELDVTPDGMGNNLHDLAEFVLSSK
jgi:2-haloacid dehalogenase